MLSISKYVTELLPLDFRLLASSRCFFTGNRISVCAPITRVGHFTFANASFKDEYPSLTSNKSIACF